MLCTMASYIGTDYIIMTPISEICDSGIKWYSWVVLYKTHINIRKLKSIHTIM